jgi:acetoacetate decarboxylase
MALKNAVSNNKRLSELPVLDIVSGMHIIADLTLPLGKVVPDYLA